MLIFLPAFLSIMFAVGYVISRLDNYESSSKPLNPRYQALIGVSPAMAAIIRRFDYDYSVFLSGLVSLASQGLIHIIARGDEVFEITRVSLRTPDFEDEQVLISALLPPNRDIFVLSSKTSNDIWRAIKVHKKVLRKNLEPSYIMRNRILFWLFICVGFVATIAVADLWQVEGHELLGGTVCFVVFSVCSFFYIGLLERKPWMRKLRTKTDRIIFRQHIGLNVMMVLGMVVVVLAPGDFADNVISLGIFCGCFLLAIAPGQMVRLRRQRGRDANDHLYGMWRFFTNPGREIIEGLESDCPAYLEIREDLEFVADLNKPKDLPSERYSELLPYAFALDCPEAWAKTFSKITEGGKNGKSASSVNWLSGDRTDPAAFGRKVESMLWWVT